LGRETSARAPSEAHPWSVSEECRDDDVFGTWQKYDQQAGKSSPVLPGSPTFCGSPNRRDRPASPRFRLRYSTLGRKRKSDQARSTPQPNMPTIHENQASAERRNSTGCIPSCREWEETDFKGYMIQFSSVKAVPEDEVTEGIDEGRSESELSGTTAPRAATAVSYDSDDSDLDFLRPGHQSDGTGSAPPGSQHAPIDTSQVERFGPSPAERPGKRAASDPEISRRREPVSQTTQPANMMARTSDPGIEASSQSFELADLSGGNAPKEPRQPEAQPEPEPEPAPGSEFDDVCCDCCGGWCLRCTRTLCQKGDHMVDVICCWLNCLVCIKVSRFGQLFCKCL
jgi:hypothetical protein